MEQIDTANLKEISQTLMAEKASLPKRYLLNKIFLGKEPRIKVLRGFRGVGKTTALLQLAGEKAVYFSMDNPHARAHSLYSLGKRLIQTGFTTLLVDEVHTCPGWKGDAKALYDEFSSLNLVLSASAPLAFEPERRFDIVDAEPLSLREFAHLQGDSRAPSEGWQSEDETISFLAKFPKAYEYHGYYAQGGGFPTWLTHKEKTLGSIYHSMLKSIREDSVFFAKVSGDDIVAMEKILLLLASAPLGEFSAHSIGSNVGVSRNKIYEIVTLLEGMKILRYVRPYGTGSKLVRGEPKLMFAHPNLRSAVCHALSLQPDVGALREELAVFSFAGRGWRVSTIKGMKRSPDYVITKGAQKAVVEIGGEGKGTRQLAGFDFRKILVTEKQLIPLAFF